VYHVVSFSGGKDSTALVIGMIERNYQIDDIIFCDTGVEFPQMYEHIDKVEKYIGRKVTKLKAEHSFEYMMFDYVKTKGKHKGEKGYGWSDFRNRWCTSYLKKGMVKRYLRQYEDVVEYHGIAVDEAHRTNKNNEKIIKYPLIEWNMTEKDCLEYCYSKGFDWGGLYKDFARVSCYLCPLQRLSELKVIYNKYPELWQKMRELDDRCIKQFGRKFRADYSIRELERKFNNT
jgi:3'-phosphoadenosine 5'-phosphosulfate sulfotransferase (PAPS reductase)/FAD synthetase